MVRELLRITHRHLYTMKSRISLYVLFIFALIVLGGIWFLSSAGSQEYTPVVTATIRRDCAPWDGSAFTLSIPVEGSVLGISIYQSPDIKLPVTFSFPDETGQVGNALLVLPASMLEPLTGKVSFQRVEQGSPVEGQFNLLTDTGEHFKGRFKAEWDDQPVYCG